MQSKTTSSPFLLCPIMIFFADSEKNICEEKIAARKLEGETFTFSLDGLPNHDFAALRFIFHSRRAVQISRVLRSVRINSLCA